MAAPVDITSYKEILIVLVMAGIIVPVMNRFRINSILGFLGAGVILGPFGLGSFVEHFPFLSHITIGKRDEMAHVAEFGIVFLLFVVGLELSWSRLMTMRRLVFGFGAAQMLVSTLVLGFLIYLTGIPVAAAGLLGAALALSSTAIVVELLSKNRRLSSTAGRITFSVLLFQDLAVIPILFMAGVLGKSADATLTSELLIVFGQSLIGLALMIAVGRMALRPLFRLVITTDSVESFMAATLLVVIGTGIAAAASGLSMAFGAFVAGLLLAETEYRREVAVTIEPFKGLLLGVFFLSVGMGVDLSVVFKNPLFVVSAALLLILIKLFIIMALGYFFKMSRAASLESGLLLGPGGEFAFVVLSAVITSSILPNQAGDLVLAIVSLSMVLIPLCAKIGLFAGHHLNRNANEKKHQSTLAELDPALLPSYDGEERAIIIGYGRVGQLIGEMLTEQNIPYISADTHIENITRARAQGSSVYYGDATRVEFLRQCGLMEARALIVTVGSQKVADHVITAARTLRPDIQIIVRARDADHAQKLYQHGVSVAVPETLEASLQLSEAALVALGVPMGKAIATIHDKRDRIRTDLRNAAL